MRLSFGFVRGQHLACLYHGWQFDAGGQCRLIPAHPEITVPKTIRATQYNSVEAAGMIWLDVTGADEALVVDGGPTTIVRSLTIDAPPALVAACLPPGPLARLDVDGLPVLAGLQPLSPGETALHLVLAGVFGAEERKCVAAWGMALRTIAEAEAT
jgi:hypothetical protein